MQVTRIDYTGDKVLVKTEKDEYLADKVTDFTVFVFTYNYQINNFQIK